MVINEQIVSSYYRRLIDKSAKLWQRISFWTKSSDVEFNDGKTAEEKVGNINGITSDFAANDDSISASSVLTHKAYNRFDEFTDGGKIKRIVIKDGKPYIEYEDGADTVLKKLGNGTVMYLGPKGSYDISQLYDEYMDLTVNNFVVECGSVNRITAGPINTTSNANAFGSGWVTVNKTYNAKTGKLTVNANLFASLGYSEHAQGSDTTSASIPIKVYLIVLPD